MKIGIIGAGAVGRAVARALSRGGMAATIANSRGPDTLREIAEIAGPGIVAGTREEAAAADLVVVAVNWSKIPAALAGLPDWNGRIVVDANNAIEAPLLQPIDLDGLTSSEFFARLVPGARVVKALNHLHADMISINPGREGGRRVLFVAGDDRAANGAVAALADRLGFYGIELGTLREGGALFQFPGGPLTSLNLVRFE
jgi:8-hydroxy-5-deazaflavin:NADPH oxidoreductase